MVDVAHAGVNDQVPSRCGRLRGLTRALFFDDGWGQVSHHATRSGRERRPPRVKGRRLYWIRSSLMQEAGRRSLGDRSGEQILFRRHRVKVREERRALPCYWFTTFRAGLDRHQLQPHAEQTERAGVENISTHHSRH